MLSITKTSNLWLFVRGIHQWQVDSLHKVPYHWNAFRIIGSANDAETVSMSIQLSYETSSYEAVLYFPTI